MGKIKRYLSLSASEKSIFAKALISLIWIKLMLVVLPFRHYAKKLGEKDKETANEPLEKEHDFVILVKDSVRRASRYNIIKPKCFAEAIVAKKLLNKKEIPSTLYLGVAKDKEQKMIAHAWLRCGNIIVTGRRGMDRFTVVSKFS